MNPYTLVCGVDSKHLHQLSYTWTTWKKHKPKLLDNPMIIFYDKEQVTEDQIRKVVDHSNLSIYDWPINDIVYGDNSGEKWTQPQRVKMLNGFLYISAMHVKTTYWLKLDTDVVATGNPNWVDETWFEESPSIISHPWGFTKPPNQMGKLDSWVYNNRNKPEFDFISKQPALLFRIDPTLDKLKHPRITSWCGFFKTGLSRVCLDLAIASGNQMPIPSQDSYMWYVATRMNFGVKRVPMKKLGWQQWMTQKNIEVHAKEAMNNG